jgi:hypothetical protein
VPDSCIETKDFKDDIVTRRGDYRLGLDFMIAFIYRFYTPLGTTGNYSVIAVIQHTLKFTVTHTLVYSVFTSRILATDLSKSHCNFKSHIKSSLQRLLPFLALILRLLIPKTRLNLIPLLPSSYVYRGRLASRGSTLLF